MTGHVYEELQKDILFEVIILRWHRNWAGIRKNSASIVNTINMEVSKRRYQL